MRRLISQDVRAVECWSFASNQYRYLQRTQSMRNKWKRIRCSQQCGASMSHQLRDELPHFKEQQRKQTYPKNDCFELVYDPPQAKQKLFAVGFRPRHCGVLYIRRSFLKACDRDWPLLGAVPAPPPIVRSSLCIRSEHAGPRFIIQ